MKSARIMFAYAGFLIACGLAAYFMAPPGANAKTALFVSGGSAVVMIVLGIMANSFPRNRKVGLLGIHIGMGLPVAFTVVFGMRAYNTFKGPDESKQYLAWILTLMAAASIAAFIAILSTRPSKDMRVS